MHPSVRTDPTKPKSKEAAPRADEVELRPLLGVDEVSQLLGGGSCTSEPISALNNVPDEVASTHSTGPVTRPPAARKRYPACSTCPSDAQDASIVVPSEYALSDLTLEILAAIVVESAATGAKTEAA